MMTHAKTQRREGEQVLMSPVDPVLVAIGEEVAEEMEATVAQIATVQIEGEPRHIGEVLKGIK